VTVVFFFVWASMIGGVAPHIVSATRMAIRILRENIYPFFNCGLSGTPTKPLGMARKVPSLMRKTFCRQPAARLEYTRREGIFPGVRGPTASGE
jgi:hypothetical protein